VWSPDQFFSPQIWFRFFWRLVHIFAEDFNTVILSTALVFFIGVSKGSVADSRGSFWFKIQSFYIVIIFPHLPPFEDLDAEIVDSHNLGEE